MLEGRLLAVVGVEEGVVDRSHLPRYLRQDVVDHPESDLAPPRQTEGREALFGDGAPGAGALERRQSPAAVELEGGGLVGSREPEAGTQLQARLGRQLPDQPHLEHPPRWRDAEQARDRPDRHRLLDVRKPGRRYARRSRLEARWQRRLVSGQLPTPCVDATDPLALLTWNPAEPGRSQRPGEGPRRRVAPADQTRHAPHHRRPAEQRLAGDAADCALGWNPCRESHRPSIPHCPGRWRPYAGVIGIVRLDSPRLGDRGTSGRD